MNRCMIIERSCINVQSRFCPEKNFGGEVGVAVSCTMSPSPHLIIDNVLWISLRYYVVLFSALNKLLTRGLLITCIAVHMLPFSFLLGGSGGGVPPPLSDNGCDYPYKSCLYIFSYCHL